MSFPAGMASPAIQYWTVTGGPLTPQQIQSYMASMTAAGSMPAFPVPTLAHQASVASVASVATPTSATAIYSNGLSSAAAAAAAAADKNKNSEERRPWTKEEDWKVVDLVKKYGTKKWSMVGGFLDGRTGKQCRERWHNHLNPSSQWEACTNMAASAVGFMCQA
jgi:hypothetical protein